MTWVFGGLAALGLGVFFGRWWSEGIKRGRRPSGLDVGVIFGAGACALVAVLLGLP